MKFINDPSKSTFEDGLAKLLVMPMDTGAWFGIVHEDNGTLSIPRSHLEPWGSGQTIETALDQDIIRVLTLGCEAMTEDRNISSILQSAAIGTSPIQFNDVCVCIPAAWSNVVRCRQKTLPVKNKRKRSCFTKRTSVRINTENLLELNTIPKRYGCVDAAANYQLNNDSRWRQHLENQPFTSLAYKTDFFFVEQDRVELIKKSLACIRKYNTQTTWTSDLCPVTHLNSDAVVIDLDQHSARIHWNAESDAPALAIPVHHRELFAALNTRAGELPLELDNTYRLYAASSAEDLHKKEHLLPRTLHEALPDISAAFWAPLLQQLADKADPRKLILIGDCALSVLSLKEAATAAGWNCAIHWPNALQTRSLHTTPARVALRAIESFHRQPFENVPFGNRYFFKVNRLMQTAADGTIKKISAMLM